jgi:hypothetical protein
MGARVRDFDHDIGCKFRDPIVWSLQGPTFIGLPVSLAGKTEPMRLLQVNGKSRGEPEGQIPPHRFIFCCAHVLLPPLSLGFPAFPCLWLHVQNSVVPDHSRDLTSTRISWWWRTTTGVPAPRKGAHCFGGYKNLQLFNSPPSRKPVHSSH